MDGATKIKFIRDDTATFEIGGSYRDDNDWLLIEQIEGIDFPSIEIFSETEAVSDGSIVTGSHVTGRSIRIKAQVKNRSLNDVCRRFAIAFFNQKHRFKLYITYMGRTRWIEGIIDGMSIPAKNVYENQTMDVTFYCSKPYFKSVDDFGKNIASATPRLAFPYIQTDTIPVVASYYNFAKNVNIENDGDVETFAQIIINMTGKVTNPVIFKDETKYIRVFGDFFKGDVINVDMVNLDVTINGEKALHKLDKTSSFTDCALAVGNNVIGFDAEDGYDNMQVNVYFNKMYMGV